MTKGKIDFFSSVTSRLGLRFNNTYLGPATGFFYKFGDQIFLISNWHVFSGRSPDSGQPLASHGGTPNQIEFGAAHIEAGILGCNRILPLTDGSNLNLWIQHPEGQSVDIAALPISYEWILPKFSVANENGRTRAEMIARVGDELFILGYPRGLSKQANMPVWKRATIAAEPEVLLEDGSKTYLVDTASREGMSGSPAILRSNSGVVPTGELATLLMYQPQTKLIGVYSGRYGADDDFAAQLGRVWRIELVDEMLSKPTRGTYELRSIN